MSEICERGLTFSFPADWRVLKYDDSSFHLRHFQKLCGGCKGVDIVAIDGSNVVWLIEVKDYRGQRRTKPQSLGEELSEKIRDSLAGILAAGCNAGNADEQTFAQQARTAARLRVVLHLEQAGRPSRLFPLITDAADLQDEMRRSGLRAVDPHVEVVNSTSQTAWSVR